MNNDNENFKEYLVKLLIDLFGKRKKLQKLSGERDIKELMCNRFTEHLGLFTFFENFSKYCETASLDIIVP